jgi:hypothetical protein
MTEHLKMGRNNSNITIKKLGNMDYKVKCEKLITCGFGLYFSCQFKLFTPHFLTLGRRVLHSSAVIELYCLKEMVCVHLLYMEGE